MRIVIFELALVFFMVLNASCSEIRSVAIFYLDPWSTSITPLSADDVVRMTEQEAPGTISISLKGATLSFLLEKANLSSEQPKPPTIDSRISDIRIVYRFYDADGKITQLSLCNAEEGFWNNGQPPPSKKQIELFLRLLPAPLFDYTINPKK